MNTMLKAIPMHAKATQGLSRSPTRANFQNRPRNLQQQLCEVGQREPCLGSAGSPAGSRPQAGMQCVVAAAAHPDLSLRRAGAAGHAGHAMGVRASNPHTCRGAGGRAPGDQWHSAPWPHTFEFDVGAGADREK